MKIHCPAYITCSANREKQQLIITRMELQHKHELTEEIFNHYPENRQLNTSESAILEPLVDLRVRPALLQHMLHNTTHKPLTKHDIQNVLRRIGAAGGKSKADLLADEIEVILQHDPSAPIAVKTDSDGTLKMLFLQTTAMRKLTDSFPEVILLDATYRTNKLKMPLFVFMVVDGFGVSQVAAHCFVANEQQSLVTEMAKTLVEFNPATCATKCIIVDKDFS